jgi:hypothetical protein
MAARLCQSIGRRANFIRYGYIYHMLRVEKFLCKAGATQEYSDSDKATNEFVKRVEDFVGPHNEKRFHRQFKNDESVCVFTKNSGSSAPSAFFGRLFVRPLGR